MPAAHITKPAFKLSYASLLLSVAALVAACGGSEETDVVPVPVDDPAQVVANPQVPPAPQPPAPAPAPAPDPAPVDSPSPGPGSLPDPLPSVPTFTTVSDEEWDETAVRKVLRTFAFGGHPHDAQITEWAEMRPSEAIVEMLTFDKHNLKLSPPNPQDSDRLWERDGTLAALAAFWASDDPDNGVPGPERYRFTQANEPSMVAQTWVRAATSRGLNPFRQKIGLWETNYHLAVDLNSVVENESMMDYYDGIMEALESDRRYDDVLTLAATSAAVAQQYGHQYNLFVNGRCRCNEDFAREYYQLFHGILGSSNTTQHELVTIKNTAAALTDMRVENNQIQYGTTQHTPGQLEVMETTIGGVTAQERVRAMQFPALTHPESLANLPVMIIAGLADDNLDDEKIGQIRGTWASLSKKSLLTFVRTYATSTIFHSASRVKYATSIDRHVTITNRVALSNAEIELDTHQARAGYNEENVQVFRPQHAVFGNQTGLEAASSADVFRSNYNRVTEEHWRFRQYDVPSPHGTRARDWADTVPAEDDGTFNVRSVGEWLWQHLINDNLKNFGVLERAHVYALLYSNADLVELIYPDDLDRVITSDNIQRDDEIATVIADLVEASLPLRSVDDDERIEANRRIGQAINFIVGTPYIFAQEGK